MAPICRDVPYPEDRHDQRVGQASVSPFAVASSSHVPSGKGASGAGRAPSQAEKSGVTSDVN